MTDSRPTALVTGGARRVGRAICLALARRGCDVHLTYRTSGPEAKTLCSDLAELGVAGVAHKVDFSDPETVSGFAARTAQDLARLDVLVHNASIYGPTPLGEIGPAEAVRHYTVNALAPLLLTQGLRARLESSILPPGAGVIAMCDIHAMGRPRGRHAAYAMSKAALGEMVASLARDLAPRVRVNGVAPGVVAFPDTGPESDPEMQRRYLSRVPLGRSGTPEEAAEAVRWLALDASYCTGQIIRIDGGRFLT